MTTKTYAQLGTFVSVSGTVLIAGWDPAGPGPLKTAPASTWRTYFQSNLGTAATADTGTSGDVVPKLNGANTWSAAQTFSNGLSGALTGNVTGNVSGSSGSCTGNAATATTAAACSGNAATATTASTVSDGAITPAKLSTGHPNWDTTGNLFPVTALTGFYFNRDSGNGHARLYFSATDYIEFDELNHQVKFILSGAQVGHVDPAFGFVNDV